MRFSDLKNHHADSIRNISKFIGVDANDSFIEHVRHHSSFTMMKKDEENDIGARIMAWSGAIRGSHIRSGGAKEKNPFSPEQLQRLQQQYEKVLEPLGMPRDDILSHKLP